MTTHEATGCGGIDVERLARALDGLWEQRWGPLPAPKGQTTINLENAHAIAAAYGASPEPELSRYFMVPADGRWYHVQAWIRNDGENEYVCEAITSGASPDTGELTRLRTALRERFHDEAPSDFGCRHQNQHPASWECEQRVRDFDDLLQASPDTGELARLREALSRLRTARPVFEDGRPNPNGYEGGWHDAIEEALAAFDAALTQHTEEEE